MIKNILTEFKDKLVIWLNPNFSNKSVVSRQNNTLVFINNLCNVEEPKIFTDIYNIGGITLETDILDDKVFNEIYLNYASLGNSLYQFYQPKNSSIISHSSTLILNCRLSNNFEPEYVYTLFQSSTNLFQYSFNGNNNFCILLNRNHSSINSTNFEDYNSIEIDKFNPFKNFIIIIIAENPSILKIYIVQKTFNNISYYSLLYNEKLYSEDLWGYNYISNTTLNETQFFLINPFWFKDLMFFNKALKFYEILFILSNFKKYYSDKLFFTE